MANPPTFSESTWLGAIVVVTALVVSAVGLAGLIDTRIEILLAVAAGAGWALSVALFVYLGWVRKRLHQVEVDLVEAQRRGNQWADASKSATDASKATVELVATMLHEKPQGRAKPRVRRTDDPE